MNVAVRLAWIALGAVLFGLAPMLTYATRPALTLDFAVDPPSGVLTGVYGAERTRDGFTWVWTRGSYTLTLPGLDRRGSWRATFRLAAQRADGIDPEIVAVVDGIVQWRRRVPAAGFVEETVDIPALTSAGAGHVRTTVTMTVSPTMVPPDDARELGVLLDVIRVEPQDFRPAMAWAVPGPMIAGGVFGALVSIFGLGGSGLSVLALTAAGTGLILTRGLGPFAMPAWTPLLVTCVVVAVLTSIVLMSTRERSRAAGLVVMLSVAFAWLHLLILAHPDMPIGDAMFHAHKFQDVLAGHYYFTSITPGDIRFPYAIALYVAGALIKPIASGLDHMLLLRLVVVATDAVAAVWLFRLVRRSGESNIAAVGAVAAYHLMPLTFNVITTGNLTNMFGQSLAIVAFAMAGTLVDAERGTKPAGAGRVAGAALAFVACLAFVSHTSTFMVLAVQLVLVGSIAVLRPATARAGAGRVLVASAAAIVVAIAVYYAYFLDVYREIVARVLDEAGGASSVAGGRTPMERLVAVPEQLGAYYGWVALGLAAWGAGVLLRASRGPLLILVGSWLAAVAGFLVLGILTPIDLRHYLAALPALAVLMGLGADRLWRAGGGGRAVAVAAAGWLIAQAAVSWMRPLGGP